MLDEKSRHDSGTTQSRSAIADAPVPGQRRHGRTDGAVACVHLHREASLIGCTAPPRARTRSHTAADAGVGAAIRRALPVPDRPARLHRAEPEHLRRTFAAYLAVWLTAYAIFLLYPTAAPRPQNVVGDGFAAWASRFLYEADPPYNCFPSLHVAHSFVSALTCYAVHRRVGMIATGAAALVALSTLFTKQHYVVD